MKARIFDFEILVRLTQILRGLLALILVAFSTVPAFAQPPQRLVDFCSRVELTPGSIRTRHPAGIGDDMVVYWVDSNVAQRKVVLIVNGNSYNDTDYTALAHHLALNGFIVGVLERPDGFGDQGAMVIDAVEATLGAVNIDPAAAGLEIALMGHSKGGQDIVSAAEQNTAAGWPLPITTLIGLSPRTEADTDLSGWDASAFLVIYGSQDEDLHDFGFHNASFRNYDQAGLENSTVCLSPPCVLIEPPLDKTMIYVYGADHSGLIGIASHPGGIFAGLPQGLDYVHPDDQFCLVRAYATAFLRWRLYDETGYEVMFRDLWRPTSVANITTFEDDELGNPAGSPLQAYFQIHPALRLMIRNFEINAGFPNTAGPVSVIHRSAGDLVGNPNYVRHMTGYAEVRWEGDPVVKWARWWIPAAARDASTMDYFSIRIGQLQGAAAPWQNTPGSEAHVTVGLQDGNGVFSWHPVTVPYPDVYADPAIGTARSAMSTTRIPVSDLVGLDLTDVERVWLNLPLSSGTLIVDSMEWHRDQ